MATPTTAPSLFLALVLLILTTTSQIHALQIAHPFNAQVPPVARINNLYIYTLSASNFSPPTAATNANPNQPPRTYALQNAPAWLSLASPSTSPPTLTGTPGTADAGVAEFVLSATETTTGQRAEMSCTLVISSEPAPNLTGRPQLRSTTDSAQVAEAEVLLTPGEAFRFVFERESFIDIVAGRELVFYATLEDHTPLPGWLGFQAGAGGEGELVFSGRAPGLLGAAEELAWRVLVIASEVVGFAGAEVGFGLVVTGDADGEGELRFQPGVVVGFREGEAVEFAGLSGFLREGGKGVAVERVSEVEAEGLPGWASLDEETLIITGMPGDNAGEQNATITVTDDDGDEASVVVRFVREDEEDSLFTGFIGELQAQAGESFEYQVPTSVLEQEGLDVNVVLPPTATWLSFNTESLTLSGEVPDRPQETSLSATMIARSSNNTSSQSFEIDIRQRAADTPSATNTLIGTRGSPTNTSTASATAGLLAASSGGQLADGAIAAIVLGSIAVAALIIGLLLFCCRRRRRGNYDRQSDDSSETKRKISRPIAPSNGDGIFVTTQLQNDVEKLAGSPFEKNIQTIREQEQAPQIALNLPERSPRKSRWSNRFSRFSQISSLGDGGDAAIRGNSDIPEWGRDSNMLSTPHQSFSVPAEIARHSRRNSELSPSKRALAKLREKHRSTQSIGLGIDSGDGSLLVPAHGSRHSKHGRGTSSHGLSATLEGSSRCQSMSTIGSSLLSTRASDFPRPPIIAALVGSRSKPTLTDAEKRKSIRLVGRSDSIVDHRSLQDKRESFIRNRRKSRLESPFLAHGSSRASSGNKLAQLTSGTDFASSQADMRRSRRGRSCLTSYSESSSLEPFRESRRLSQRVRSTFGPNFPRTITRSSLGAQREQQVESKQAGVEKSESSRSFYTTSSSISDTDFRDEMALPRHQRNFVLPGEASPTPPPVAAPPSSRRPSYTRRTYSSSSSASGLSREAARQRWKDRLNRDSKGNIRDVRPSSPLSTAIAVPAVSRNSLTASGKASQARRSRLSDPMNLVSQDSLSGVMERPKLVHTSSGRPVSVDKAERFSSLRAESGDARAGSEEWEDGTGLIPPPVVGAREVGTGGTGKSSMSGIAFL
ncbi:hypothetical protein MBLNU230_g1535t1 [Neophaeotheca triangularis]